MWNWCGLLSRQGEPCGPDCPGWLEICLIPLLLRWYPSMTEFMGGSQAGLARKSGIEIAMAEKKQNSILALLSGSDW